MSDPFTDPIHNNSSSNQTDPFSNFTSFEQFGKNKKKSNGWTGFKKPSLQETQFKNFDFDSGKELYLKKMRLISS